LSRVALAGHDTGALASIRLMLPSSFA